MWYQNFLTDTPERSEPRPTEHDEEEVSTQLNTSNCGAFLEVSRNKLVVRYTGPGRHGNDVGSIQGNYPVPKAQVVYYFELLVKEKGDKGDVSIGFADKHFKMGRAPGWEPGSYGYHGIDGKRLHKSASSNRDIEDYAEPYTAGDVVGAGIILGRQDMFFTKNGRHLGVAFKNVCSVPLFPTIGMHSPGECVGVNFGRSPFIFDLDALVAQEREMQQDAVSSMSLGNEVSQAVVRDYLLHHGYADTLAAFDRSSACTDEEFPKASAPSPSANGHRHSSSPSSPPSNGHAASSAAAPGTEQWLLVRRDVRQLIMAGNPQAAHHLLQQRCPQVLDQRQAQSAAPAFHLACLSFVELVRQGKSQQAVEYARTHLAPLRSLKGPNSHAYGQMLHDVAAILAYEHPEDSPEVRDLLDVRQREITADVINHAMLAVQPAPPWHSFGRQPPWAPPKKLSVLEAILRQLLATQEALLETNGGFGVPFCLESHLRPAGSPQKASPAWHLQ